MAFAVPQLSRTLLCLSPRQTLARAAAARGAGHPRLGGPLSSPPAQSAAPPRHAARVATPITSMAASPPVPGWDPAAATAEVVAGASFIRCVDIARGVCGALGGGGDDGGGDTSAESPAPSAADVALLRALLTSSNGARGFFVSYLGDPDVTVADAPPPAAVVDALTEAVVAETGSTSRVAGGGADDRAAVDAAAAPAADAGVVPPLLAKNLVMSSGMVVAYREADKTDLAAGSALTATRTELLLRSLLGGGADEGGDGADGGGAAAAAVPAIRLALGDMQTSVSRALDGVRGEAGGVYGPFLVKWGYTDAQLEAMRDALGRVL